MQDGTRGFIFGSYGIVRGYGPLCQSIEEADRSVFKDAEKQRKFGGATDRNAVAVSRLTGLCWWVDDGEDIRESELIPVKTAHGDQASYPREEIAKAEARWNVPG